MKGERGKLERLGKVRDEWEELVGYKRGEEGEGMMERKKENGGKKK